MKKTNKIPKRFYIKDKRIFDFEQRLSISEKLENSGIDLINTYKYLEKCSIVLEYGPTTALMVMEDAVVIIRKGNKSAITVVCADIQTAKRIYQEAIVWMDNTIPTYSYLVEGKRGFIERTMELKPIKVDLEKNYNDDLPLNEIMNFMKNDNPGIIMLNGEPGTGKSSLIKYLISEIPDKKFVIIQPETLAKSNSDQFIEYFTDRSKGTVFILEDCEKILMRRDKGTDLHTVLNLSDGILGDSLSVKFLCTFNTDLRNIDTALLRKGRLKVRYEMGKLSLEKTKLHIPEATEGMTLAEIYNREENSYGKQERKKIGF